jgi:hypothetical protein
MKDRLFSTASSASSTEVIAGGLNDSAPPAGGTPGFAKRTAKALCALRGVHSEGVVRVKRLSKPSDVHIRA